MKIEIPEFDFTIGKGTVFSSSMPVSSSFSGALCFRLINEASTNSSNILTIASIEINLNFPIGLNLLSVFDSSIEFKSSKSFKLLLLYFPSTDLIDEINISGYADSVGLYSDDVNIFCKINL